MCVCVCVCVYVCMCGWVSYNYSLKNCSMLIILTKFDQHRFQICRGIESFETLPTDKFE